MPGCIYTCLSACSLVIILHFIHVQSFSWAVTLPPRLLEIHSCIWAAVWLGSVKSVCCRLLFAQRAARAVKWGESITPVGTKKEHASWTTVPWPESAAPSYTVCKKSCTLWSARWERGKNCSYHVEAKTTETAAGLSSSQLWCWHQCSLKITALSQLKHPWLYGVLLSSTVMHWA